MLIVKLSDGMNGKGFAGHMLWLAESDYGSFDTACPGLSVGLWLRYYLDSFAIVNEAVARLLFKRFEPAEPFTMPPTDLQ